MTVSRYRRARRRVTRPLVALAGWFMPWPYRLYVGSVLLTSRRTWVGWDEAQAEIDQSGGGVLGFYHEGMLIAPYAVRRMKILTLTTPVAAGTLVAGILKHFNMVVLRSRGRDTRSTLRDVVQGLRSRPGYSLGLAVDGSSGPARVPKPGAAIIARTLGVPLYAVHFGLSRSLRYPSWDRCRLPLPFGRVVLRIDRVEPPQDGAGGITRLTAALAEQLEQTAMLAEQAARGKDQETKRKQPIAV